MGSVQVGPPAELVLTLKQRYGVEHFVETGTYYAQTALWAAQHFKRVTTIEYSKGIYDEVCKKYGSSNPNIEFVFGDSKSQLKIIVPELKEPCIFWLDAHWSGGKTYGADDECPLITELEIINRSEMNHFIFIDDARLFLSPPPRPHRVGQWPSISSIISVLQSGKSRYIAIAEDVIIAVPEEAQSIVAQHCQDVNTKSWEESCRNESEKKRLVLRPGRSEQDGKMRRDGGGQVPIIKDNADLMRQFLDMGLCRENEPLKIHLGCGETHLQGYINIDFPPSEHTVQVSSGADVFGDVRKLDLPGHSVSEVRLHHLFEHFDRATAMALLCKWQQWLTKGGVICIETPDVEAGSGLFSGRDSSYEQRQQVLRHIFGSHEAGWAIHKDGWYEGKFQRVLGALGFAEISFSRSVWKTTHNITVTAKKADSFDSEKLCAAAKKMLRDYMIDESPSEEKLWSVWCEKFDEVFGPCGAKQAPTVSIFMSVLNGEKYVADTIESILNQTYRDFELVIVDDGSDDGTFDIVQSCQRRDARLKVIRSPHKGVVEARNQAIEHTNPCSRYLMNHDADDISLPGKLEKLVRYLEGNPRVAIVGCLAEYFDDEGNSRGQPALEWDVEKIRQTFGEVNSMIHSASLIRRQVLEKIGGYREDYVPAEDYDFFARALLSGFNLANIQQVLHKIRLHPGSICSVRAESMKVAADGVRRYYIAQQQKQSIPTSTCRDLSKKTSKLDDSLKILHTVEFYHPHVGGSESVVQQLSERLVKRGHKVTVATTKLPERKVRGLNGVEIEEFDVRGSLARGFMGGDVARYREFLLKHPSDVMMNYAAQQWATDLAFETLDSTGERRVNIIAPCGYSALKDATTLWAPEFKDYFIRVIPAYLPKYDAAVYHSACYQDYLFARNHNFTNSVVIPNGVCEEEFSRAPGIDFRRKYDIKTKFFGLCVANFYPGKGQERVIECVRQMNRPDFTVVFIGNQGGEIEKLRRQGGGLNVRFCVGISRDDVLAAYHQADIFLFASEKECSPLVILEAKASRVPFVSTDCGNVREWSGGVVCPPDKMATYANRLLDDDEIRRILAEEGFRQWKEKFTWESVVDRYEDLYQELHRKKAGLDSRAIPAVFSHAKSPCHAPVTTLVFSKDRAMQLQATIESFKLHCRDSDAAELVVLFKTSNEMHRGQYEKLKERFAEVAFLEETDFSKQVLSVVERCRYVLFLVDDNIFVKDFSLRDVVAALDSEKEAIGFSLRLGRNTDYCYMLNSPQKVPRFENVRDGILKYHWPSAEHDFGYPLEVSSSVYRSGEILQLLKQIEFANPNTLESQMSQNAKAFISTVPVLLVFEQSVTFCNPVNIVQRVYENNRFGTVQGYTCEQLADRFSRGIAIDVRRYAGFTPGSAHHEVELYFTAGERASAGQASPYVSCEHKGTILKPKFSIVMANYNNGRYIRQAIESVLSQTFRDWELIIVDDCSTDDSIDIIKRYLTDDRVRLIRHDTNKGYIAALKIAIADVRSEIFGILDSDDCLTANAVETMYQHHISFPDSGLIYSQFAYCRENLTQRCMGFCDKIPPGKTSLDVNVVSHFKTFKLKDYLKTSGYDENILYAEDVDIAYKMEEVTGLKFVDECLYLYRELPGSICHSRSKINVAIMSRVKARINALKRRCAALAESGNKNFEDLFADAVKQARVTYKDVEQYFVILAKLYENNLLLPDSSVPVDVKSRDAEGKLLWLAANVNIKFDKLFDLLAGRTEAGRQPLITVYMVTYNAQKFIARAIYSVLSQTYKNFELLIVDDGSTDKTKEAAASYSDDRIRYIYQEHKNFASGVNRAIGRAKGKYIIGVDSDDFIAPDYIEKMVAFAEKHPQTDYFYPAQLTLVNESGDPTGQQWNYMEFSDNSVLPAFLFRNCYGPIPNPGSLKRKTVFDKVGLYDEVDTVEDFAFLCKNALKINFKRVDEHATYFYRRHQQSNSQKVEARNRIMADVLNEMVSIYPDEVLYPQIADISDADLRKRRYNEYVVETFCRHSNGPMVQFGHYFQKYAARYKSKLQQFSPSACRPA